MELLQVIVKRIRALEDAYHENTRAFERLQGRLESIEGQAQERTETGPSEQVLDRVQAVEGHLSNLERLGGELPSLAARLFVLDERLDGYRQRLEDHDALLEADEERRAEAQGIVDRVVDLESRQETLLEAAEAPIVRLLDRVEVVEERLSNIESLAADFRSIADHVIAHEAQLVACEHEISEQAKQIGAMEEQSAVHQGRFDIYERQMASYRGELNAHEERQGAIQEQLMKLGALERRIDAVEEHQMEMPAVDAALLDRMDSLEQRLVRLAEPLSIADARFASLAERLASIEGMNGDVASHASQIRDLRERQDEVTGSRLEAILERLASVDALAADVSAHAGQLAALHERFSQPVAAPVPAAGNNGSEILSRLHRLDEQVRALQDNSTMMDSIRTLLASSDVEKALDEMRQRLARIDAQLATLFTLQRVGVPENGGQSVVVSLEKG